MRFLLEAANARIAIEDGHIVEACGRFDHVIRVPDGEVRPGLVNAHDHLHRNHYGRLGVPPYANAYDWARDVRRRFDAEIARGQTLPRRTALLGGAWKNLICGVTHVVHHDAWEPDFERDFPIDVLRIACADSPAMTPADWPPEAAPFALHLAEGVDRAAAEEVRDIAARGLLGPGLLAVHVVGPDAAGIAQLRQSGCALVWCPTSNHFLFGRTAPDALLAEGMDVLLGSDSLLSGDGTLLDELRAARGTISDARLEAAVGSLAARRLGLGPPALVPGKPADLVLFRRPLPEAQLQDVVLVMAAGQLRVLDPQSAPLPRGGQMLHWRGVRRWISEVTPLEF